MPKTPTTPTPFLPTLRRRVDWRNHDTAARRDALAATIEPAAQRGLLRGAERFVPPDDLVAAINAALASRSPLLLTGDPGTGKTETAYFLARWLGLHPPGAEPDDPAQETFAPLHVQVRSDSTAADLRWDFDAVAYFNDAHTGKIQTSADGSDPRADGKYLRPGPLWRAYRHDGECVVLIDEIDKAPRDFPNDLLQELSDLRFAHPYGGEPIENRGPPPILIITSNGERRLPDPFLRRCVVCHLELNDDLLQRILDAWESAFAAPTGGDRTSPPPPTLASGVRDAVLPAFNAVRKKLRTGRPPGAAELLVWVNALAVLQVPAEHLDPDKPAELPALHCLVKEHEDHGSLA